MTTKLTALFLLAAAIAPAFESAADDAARYLAAARAAWGILDTEDIRIVMDRTLNGGGCRMSATAATEFAFVEAHRSTARSTVRATLSFEDNGDDDVLATPVPVAVAEKTTDVTTWHYVIRVNSNCHWDPATYANVILHECGHIMLGAKYHSKDRHSVMYPLIDSSQKITDADRGARASAAAVVAAQSATK